MKTWRIWTVSPFTGDCKEMIAEYANRGHAVRKIEGLRRAAWRARSEMQYALRDESARS